MTHARVLRQLRQRQRRVPHNAVNVLVEKIDQEANAILGDEGAARVRQRTAELGNCADRIFELLLRE